LPNKWLPIILEEQCTGCGLCVEACGPRSLAMAEGIAVLAFPDTCGSEEHCISACPEDAIQMAWLPFSGDRAVGRWSNADEPLTPMVLSIESVEVDTR
jgi:Na+-translocating ferredoxin:NAD+ oxidoreductase RNF subunit RnfB